MAELIRVAIAGATGYSGIELMRWLLVHPEVEIVRVTARQQAGKRVDEVVRGLSGRTDLVLEALDPDRLGDGVDVAFTALPHGASAETVVKALAAGARVVDLSADFRLTDAAVFEKWYGPHEHAERIAEAVYGIPEIHREALADTRLVANPGCYPTGALFGLVPICWKGGLAEGRVIVDSKSGASGAGRAANADLLYVEIAENFRAYSVGRHRHTPEIQQGVERAGGSNPVVFTPHLAPMRRGILSTIYVPIDPDLDLDAAFHDAWGAEIFVHLLGEGRFPEVRDVRGTNDVQIGWTRIDPTLAVVVTAIDNLGRGAATQAIQNMNVMLGFAEHIGLTGVPLIP